MEEKRGRIKKDVIEYINSREWYQIYWRLFGLTEETTAIVTSAEEKTDEVKLPDTE
jgi:hypothetical protein